ncbi:hypothetical protein L0B53_12625 [Vibrio sp. SS-MA-C1-2]|uniref:hypothetical protein n=1 Tax=Vibrio sp. SS-MA-C1-2 TaxID=2908646 RepID=UPI001F1FAD53|nr:hypothetical protein [Vibrio sp. SS-MA-C1-2]UJF17869.1 hypothetical protein L0B53_12625 [Vibrio sp. SS-MA-C1-2]
MNRRQLLDVEKSGGAGFGFDMGIHAVAGLVRYLQKSGLLSADLSLTNVVTEALNDKRLIRTIGAETHIYVSGKLTFNEQCCDLLIEAGKAGDTWDRRLELHYDHQVIAIGLGTLKHPPYLWYFDRMINRTELVTFDVAGSGYSMHFNDILTALGLKNQAILTEIESEQLMSHSMNLLADIFNQLGESPQQRESNLTKVPQHNPKFLSQDELKVRAQLSGVLGEIILY